MATIDKVKVLVLGDSGVGKSSLTHLISANKPLNNPSWTIGCSVDVKLHEYREGLAQQRSFFIELWDVGGSVSHRETRSVFYHGAHGVILVHDLSNRKSQVNLRHWLSEVVGVSFDSEQLIGSASYLPVLVIGTKMDAAAARSRREVTFAEEIGADEIILNCLSLHALAAGSSAAVKLSRFFDQVIFNKLKYNEPFHGDPINYKRTRFVTGGSNTTATSPITITTTTTATATNIKPYYHMD